MCIRTRNWFSLLARTAIKTGATLPIYPSPKGRPPDPTIKQVVLFDPHLYVRVISYITIPEPTFSSATSTSEEEPEVFEVESTIQSALSICS